MLTVGVDLAAEARGTAACVVSWSQNRATIERLKVGVSDLEVLELARSATFLGIDCAFGWPLDFVAFLAENSEASSPPPIDGGLDWRRRTVYRETDRYVRLVTGKQPLSVAADRLGLTALRCAGLLGRLSAAGIPVRRDGAGPVFEVYPAASLRIWSLEERGYKIGRQARERLLARLCRQAPWLELGDFSRDLVNSADAFDALIAALTTRAAGQGLSPLPDHEVAAAARAEGWIMLPPSNLGALQ